MQLNDLQTAFEIIKRNRNIIDNPDMAARFDEQVNAFRMRYVFQHGPQPRQDFTVSIGLHEEAQAPYYGFVPVTVKWKTRTNKQTGEEQSWIDMLIFHQAWDIHRGASIIYFPGNKCVLFNGKMLTRRDTELAFWAIPDFHMEAFRRLGFNVEKPELFALIDCIMEKAEAKTLDDELWVKDLYFLSIEELIASKLLYEVALNRYKYRLNSRMQPDEFKRSMHSILNAYRMNDRKYVHKRQLVLPSPLMDSMDDRIAWQVTPQSEKAGTVVQMNIGVEVKDGLLVKTEGFRPVPEILTNLAYRHISPNRMPPAAAIAQQVCTLTERTKQLITYKNDVAGTSQDRMPVVTFATQSKDVYEDTIWISDRVAKMARAIQKETYRFMDPLEIKISEGEFVESLKVVAIDRLEGEVVNPVGGDVICTKIREKFIENTFGKDPTRYVFITLEREVPVELGDKFALPFSAKATVAGIFPHGSRWVIANRKRCDVDVIWPANLKKRAYVPVEELLTYKEMILGDAASVEIDPDNVPAEILQIDNVTMMETDEGITLTGRLGIQNLVRLAHTAESKWSVRADLALDDTGAVRDGAGNIKTSGLIYTLHECGASQSLAWLNDQAKKSKMPFLVRERLSCCGLDMQDGMFHLKGYMPFQHGTLVTKAIDLNTMLNEITPEFLEDSIWQANMIAACIRIPKGAFFLRTDLSFRKCKDKKNAKDFFLKEDLYLPVPSNLRSRLFPGPAGNLIVDNVSRSINALIVNANRDMSSAANVEKLHYSLQTYWRAIEDSLSGKDGMLRDLVYPRVENSIRGVAGSDPTLQMDEVRVGVGAMRRILESDAGKRLAQHLFYMKDMSNSDVVRLFDSTTVLGIVIREPIHNKGNTPVMRIRLAHKDRRVSVHPGCISMFAGDFDGDQLAVIVPPRELYPELLQGLAFERLVHEGYLSLSKQLKPFKDDVQKCETVGDMTELVNYAFDAKRGWAIPVCETTEREDGDEVQKQRWIKVFAGLNDEDMALLNKQASNDYRTIKVGTAQMGAIANIFRALAWNEGSQELMQEAHKFYHKFANLALDAKNGGLCSELQEISKAVYAPKDRDKWDGSRLGLFESILEDRFFTPEGFVKNNLTGIVEEELPGFLCISKKEAPLRHRDVKDCYTQALSDLLF